MPKSVRIQRKRTKGYNMQRYSQSINSLEAIYVGRATIWGNPFRVVQYKDGQWAVKTDGTDACNAIVINYCRAVYGTKRPAAIDAVRCYEMFLSVAEKGTIVRILKGKNLACWCSLAEPCHADVLLRLANAEKNNCEKLELINE